MTTFLELQTRVREYLEDADSAAYQWSATIVKRYINDAARDFAIQTRCIKKLSAALAASGTTPVSAFYTLPSDIYELDGVINAGLAVPLATAEQMPWDWQSETGSTPIYAVLGDYVGDELRVYPYSVAALTALKVWYTAVPAAMSGDNDTPTGIPGVFHPALAFYAVAECYRRNFEDGDIRKAAEFSALYAAAVLNCASSTARRRTSAPVTIPYREV